MTHDEYIKRRDEVLSKAELRLVDTGWVIKSEGTVAEAIDQLVLDVIGDGIDESEEETYTVSLLHSDHLKKTVDTYIEAQRQIVRGDERS